MGLAKKNQRIQDWITQQWVILSGRRIDSITHKWLIGPFGEVDGIGFKFIDQLAAIEQLVVERSGNFRGLLDSIHSLGLSESEVNRLSPDIIDFYENTSNYDLRLKVKWNSFFKFFGTLLIKLFTKRIEQLNIPIENVEVATSLTHEIVKLVDPETHEVKRTIWLRTFKSTGQVVYSGVYETCSLPSNQICIKAIFPLPNGNATVLLVPNVGRNGELILDSSGRKFGDGGFYFLLGDSKGRLWSKFISSFRDKLVFLSKQKSMTAIQTLTLWNFKVAEFEYEIVKTGNESLDP